MWIVNYNKTLIQINREVLSFDCGGFISFYGGLYYKVQDISMLCEVNDRNKAIVERLSPYIEMVIE